MSLQRLKKTVDEAMNATARAIRKNDTDAKTNMPLSFAKHKWSYKFSAMRLTDMPGQVVC